MDFSYADIAGLIDHALLNPPLTDAELDGGCRLAVRYQVASVCILPFYLPRCAELLAGSPVRPGTTVGFPHGGHRTAVKAAEAGRAVADGAAELDMVVNVGKVLGGDWDYVRRDIAAVIDVAHAAGRRVKVIFENGYLADAHKVRLCEICGELNADWVKTATGFGPGGATAADVRLMRRHTPPHVGVKAAGGVRDLETLLEFRGLGATRVGTSRTRDLLDECRRRLGLEPLAAAPG
jgi:deoxyribose-phosphate aldolase